MSLYSDFSADYQFERDYPFGLPSDYWTTKTGQKIRITEMTNLHILNCMNLVGQDDAWYGTFVKELKRRKLI